MFCTFHPIPVASDLNRHKRPVETPYDPLSLYDNHAESIFCLSKLSIHYCQSVANCFECRLEITQFVFSRPDKASRNCSSTFPHRLAYSSSGGHALN